MAAGLAAVAIAALVVGLRSSDASPEPPPSVVPDSLARIDPATNAMAQVTPVGRDPDQLAVGGGAVWVVNHRDRTVSRVASSG